MTDTPIILLGIPLAIAFGWLLIRAHGLRQNTEQQEPIEDDDPGYGDDLYFWRTATDDDQEEDEDVVLAVRGTARL